MVLMQKPSMIEPPPIDRRKRSPDGISWVQKVAVVEKWFRGSPGCFQGILVYIGERSRSVQPRGAHEGGGRAYPPWHGSLPLGFLVASLTSTPSLLDCVCSKNNSPEGFIPFGFRLIFLFCEALKQAKNNNLHWAFGQQVSPKNNTKEYNKAH